MIVLIHEHTIHKHSPPCIPSPSLLSHHFFQLFHHGHPCLKPLHPLKLLPPVAVDTPVVRVQVYKREVVALAGLEIVGVMGGSDLEFGKRF